MDQVSAERVVGWVDGLARAVGGATVDREGLLAAVRGALGHAGVEGRVVDRVSVRREEGDLEIRLASEDGAVDTFVFQA